RALSVPPAITESSTAIRWSGGTRRRGRGACPAVAGSLDLRPHHQTEADQQGNEQPGDAGDGDVGPFLAGQGVGEGEQPGLGELDVDPGLQRVEPLLRV